MEQVLEQERAAKLDWRNIEMYYDDGRKITNPSILQSMAEAEALADEWEKRINSYNLDAVFGNYDE